MSATLERDPTVEHAWVRALMTGADRAPVPYRGAELLEQPLLNKDTAFTDRERDAFGLHGLLPTRVLTIEEQVALAIERNRRKGDEPEHFIGLAAPQGRT